MVYTRHHHSPARKPRRARGRGLTGHSSSSDTECPSQLGTSPSLDSRCSISLLLDVRTVPLLGKSVHQAEAAEKPPEGRSLPPWSHGCHCQGTAGWQKPWPRKHRAAFLMGKLLDHPIKMRLLVSTWKKKRPSRSISFRCCPNENSTVCLRINRYVLTHFLKPEKQMNAFGFVNYNRFTFLMSSYYLFF